MKEKPNKAFSILRTFSKRDLRMFDRFVQSAYFNPHPITADFYELLRKFHPQYDYNELKKEKLFRRFFPKQKFNDKKIRYLFTDLTRLLEKYLAVENFLSNEQKFSRRLLDEHTKRENIHEFNRLFKEAKNDDESKERKDASFFLHQFLTEYKYLNFVYPYKKRKEESNIEKTLEYLDLFYLSRKLELSCEVENVRSLLQHDYKSFMMDELAEKINGHAYMQEPVIAVYLSVLRMLGFMKHEMEGEREGEKEFNRLTGLLKQHEQYFSQKELRELYQYPLNFCIRKINLGKTEYMQRIFEIYKVILENKALLPGGKISQWDFKNIATVSLRLKEFNWCKNFIHRFKEHLSEKEKENAFVYNTANLHFQKGEFSKALKLLQTVEFTDMVYQLDTRSMLLKIYYETDDEETLFFHFSAFRKFIRRARQLSKYQQANYRNMIRFTQKLVRCNGEKETLKKLKEEINSNAQVADVSWLKQKIEERI